MSGDSLEANWDGADQLDCYDKPDDAPGNDSDYELEDGSSDSKNKTGEDNSKKSKKKRKFEALKDKKTDKLNSNSEQEVSLTQLPTDEMVMELVKNKPKLLKFPDFQEGSFFFPDFAVPQTASKTKKVCPFVRALSTILPNYKKVLVGEIDGISSELFGCPILIIICASAIRATEIIKSVSSKLIKCKIAKLFAKHFKLEEQIDMLSKEYFPIAIGTPNRLRKLVEYGALKLSAAKVVLVDLTPDVKRFNILTSNDVKSDFYPLLCEDIYPERSHLKIALIKDGKSS